MLKEAPAESEEQIGFIRRLLASETYLLAEHCIASMRKRDIAVSVTTFQMTSLRDTRRTPVISAT